jgi:hypothetical protein
MHLSPLIKWGNNQGPAVLLDSRRLFSQSEMGGVERSHEGAIAIVITGSAISAILINVTGLDDTSMEFNN